MTLHDMSQSELAEELGEATTKKPEETTGLQIVNLDHFLTLQLPVREHILSPWLNTQGIALIYAPRGVGKTHVALGIAYAVASGGEFLRWQAPKPRGVLYLDGEMPANMLQERLAAIVAASPKKIAAPFHILTPDLQPTMSMPDLSTIAGRMAIDPHLENIELIVVDNIATLCRSGRENETESWRPVQDWALRMRASNRAVLFIHHAGKKGTQRGASAHEDTIDTILSLSRPSDYSATDGAVFEIHFEKARSLLGDAVKPFTAKLTKNKEGKQQWVTDEIKENAYIQIAGLLKNGYKQHEIAEQLNLHKSKVSRYTQKAKSEGLLVNGHDVIS